MSFVPRIAVTALAVLLAGVAGAACQRAGERPLHADDGGDPPSTGRPVEPKPLELVYDRTTTPVAGTAVGVIAEGLPPNQTVDLLWGTVEGGWVVEDYYRFKGKRFTESTRSLGRAQVDDTGRLAARFTIPEDFGGVHEIIATDGGVTMAQGGIEVGQTFEMHPTEGPVGTMIEVRVTGLGWRTMESTWVVNWDNREVGWVSATDTRGTAVARFRAAGPAGLHEVKLLTGYMGQGYLNHEQAPNAYLPRPGFVFDVTPGAGVAPAAYAEPYPAQPVPAVAQPVEGVTASISPSQGPVLTPATLTAGGLPAGAAVSVVWGTQAGSRVSGDGFAPQETGLATLVTDAEGRLSATLTIPEDLGGLHEVAIRSGSETLARTFFVVETSIVSISPASGPVGTPVTIRLKGVGWTDYDNIYIATYDNAYMGYACGFNSQGDVVINFTAAGSPGLHLIDLYPGIYQGPEGGQQLYRLPQLTYADDHPGSKIPALRFAFEVTPGSARSGDGATQP